MRIVAGVWRVSAAARTPQGPARRDALRFNSARCVGDWAASTSTSVDAARDSLQDLRDAPLSVSYG